MFDIIYIYTCLLYNFYCCGFRWRRFLPCSPTTQWAALGWTPSYIEDTYICIFYIRHCIYIFIYISLYFLVGAGGGSSYCWVKPYGLTRPTTKWAALAYSISICLPSYIFDIICIHICSNLCWCMVLVQAAVLPTVQPYNQVGSTNIYNVSMLKLSVFSIYDIVSIHVYR